MNSLLVRHRALRSKNPNAFTLIELIVVIVIIGILAAVAAVAYNSFIAGADLSAKESTSVQTAKLIQAQSALDQSTQCSMDASRSGSGSQTNFTDLSFSSDIPTDVTTLNMTACNLSVVFDDGTVCSGVTFPTNTPGASYTGTWTCGDLTLPASSESVLTTAGNGTLLVSWTTPPDTGGSPVIEYTATTSPGGATCTAPAPNTSCTITGLTNGTPYTATVTARTVAGTGEVSSSSNPATPQGPFNSATCTGCTTIDVADYNGTGETWRVHTFSPGTSSLNVTGSANDFRVLWVGGGGQSNGFSPPNVAPYHNGFGGGGGAGRMVEDNARTIPAGTYPVVVAEPILSPAPINLNTGPPAQESSFHGQNAPGGGNGGGMVLGRGGNGGSSGGGGGCHCNVSYDNSGTPVPASPLPGFGSTGFKGNTGVSSGYGGGASGNAIAGRDSDITGSAVEYSRGAYPGQPGYSTPGSSGLSPAGGVVIVAYQLP